MVMTSPKSASATDRMIGQNICTQRNIRGLTQQQLGQKLDVTHQQILKYENGTSRVGSGRLYQIAEILDVPVFTFFDAKKPAFKKPPLKSRNTSPYALLDDPMSTQMVKEFSKIAEKKTRRLMLALVERIVAAKRRTTLSGN
jgi:transcriptional regulator with XRE-family HTH domain